MPEENINPNDPQNPVDENPTLPTDEGSDTAGANSGDTGGDTAPPPDNTDAKIKDLEDKLQEATKRISGQSRSWQEERTRAEKAEAELKRYRQYIDPSDLDSLVGGEESTQPNTPATDPQITNRMNMLEFRLLQSDYALKHPDEAFVFNDTDLKMKAEMESVQIMQKEIAEYGRIIQRENRGAAGIKTVPGHQFH